MSETTTQHEPTQHQPHVHTEDCQHDHHHHTSHQPFVRATPKIGRNEACPCGSGKKYKKCCAAK